MDIVVDIKQLTFLLVACLCSNLEMARQAKVPSRKLDKKVQELIREVEMVFVIIMILKCWRIWWQHVWLISAQLLSYNVSSKNFDVRTWILMNFFILPRFGTICRSTSTNLHIESEAKLGQAGIRETRWTEAFCIACRCSFFDNP